MAGACTCGRVSFQPEAEQRCDASQQAFEFLWLCDDAYHARYGARFLHKSLVLLSYRWLATHWPAAMDVQVTSYRRLLQLSFPDGSL
jgi:hypothetical protein